MKIAKIPISTIESDSLMTIEVIDATYFKTTVYSGG